LIHKVDLKLIVRAYKYYNQNVNQLKRIKLLLNNKQINKNKIQIKRKIKEDKKKVNEYFISNLFIIILSFIILHNINL
jgi:hypothetical protein